MPLAPWTQPAGINGVLEGWIKNPWVKPCLCADETLRATDGVYAEIPSSLNRALAGALRRRGIDRLYSHQAGAFAAASEGRHLVVATPTASGKSLAFHLPVLQAQLDDPDARAVYIYPTKALARDQEVGLRELMESAELSFGVVVYDGDTPADARRAARERAGVIITNPDMLHTGLLPHHASWARTMQHLRYIIVDELHTYKGVLGSHVANVLRRLMRVALFHGSRPQFIGATATIGNPREHAARLFGVPEDDLELIDESGAPRGERRFFLFNPPVVNAQLGIRASYVKQAVRLTSDLVSAGVPTILFGQSRNAVEVMLRYLRNAVSTGVRRTDRGSGIEPSRIMAYRGGYLPAQRRDIERRLRAGEILGIVATNALELGIDIGELDAVVCAGYPGSIAGTWQRLGRAGRRGGTSIGVLVASSAPVDQYLAREPQFLLGGPLEHARIDPDNVEILVQHLKCAAFELPFRRLDAFGSLSTQETADALGFLVRHRVLHESAAAFHWASDSYPANDVSLRSVGWNNVVIIDIENDRSIAELDWRSAHTMLHEKAIYQHDGACWQVERFDYENEKAFVRRVEPDYWTDAMTYAQISIIDDNGVAPLADGWMGGWGEVAVVEKVVGYKKIKYYTHENAGYGDVRLPEMQIHTTAFWLAVPEDACTRISHGRGAVIDGLRGIGVALGTVATLALMCDPRDLGLALEDGGTLSLSAGPMSAEQEIRRFSPTLFLYEHVPGGTGLAERIWEQQDMLLGRTLRLLETCPCDAGCPACVGPGEPLRKRVAIQLLRCVVQTPHRTLGLADKDTTARSWRTL